MYILLLVSTMNPYQQAYLFLIYHAFDEPNLVADHGEKGSSPSSSCFRIFDFFLLFLLFFFGVVGLGEEGGRWT